LEQSNRFLPDYDVVVVGSGVGGLSAAVALSNKGKSVLVLEQHNMTGGYSSSFVRGRYEFEVSLHELCECGDGKDGHTYGGVRKKLADVGVNPDFVCVPDAYRVIFENYDLDFTMPFGIENAIKAVAEIVPEDEDKVRNYFKLCEEISEALVYIEASGFNPDPMTMATKHSSFLRTAAYSLGEVHRSMGFSKITEDILSAYYGYITRDREHVSFTVYGLLMYLYIRDGAHVINKTSHGLSCDLEDRARANGTQIETSVRVAKLIVENGTVCGVETSDGTKIRAKRVLCNCAPDIVYTKMMDKADVPEAALKQCGARKLGSSLGSVYIGLDALPEELGITSYEFFLNQDQDATRVYEATKEWTSQITNMSATCLDVAIPGMTGPDRCQIGFTYLLDPDAMAKAGIDPLDYQKNKEDIVNYLIDKFERLTGAHIRGHIEEVEMATPATYIRYSGVPKGNIYCYEMSVVDGIVPRTLAIAEEQFMPGLDIVGGFGRRAFGYCSSITNGFDVAADTLKKLGVN
jgi:prolycopene isomerase